MIVGLVLTLRTLVEGTVPLFIFTRLWSFTGLAANLLAGIYEVPIAGDIEYVDQNTMLKRERVGVK